MACNVRPSILCQEVEFTNDRAIIHGIGWVRWRVRVGVKDRRHGCVFDVRGRAGLRGRGGWVVKIEIFKNRVDMPRLGQGDLSDSTR